MNNLLALLVSWKKRLAWAMAALLLLWGLGWLAVPSLLKGQIESRGSEALGRKLSIGGVDFKPWTLEFTVTDLTIAKQDGSASQLALARLYVDAELQSILRLAPVVDAVTVQGLQVSLTHMGDGSYDIDDILQRLVTPDDGKPAAPVRFALHNLQLEDGSVDFTDQAGGAEQQHALRKLHLELPFLSNLDSQREVTLSPRLAFSLNGSDFDSSMQGTPFAQIRKGEAQIKIARFDLAPYLPYLPKRLPVKPLAAMLDADLKLIFSQSPQVAVMFAGGLTVSQLALTDAAGGELLTVDSIRAELSDVRPLEQMVKLASIEVTTPRLKVVRQANGRINLNIDAKKESNKATATLAEGQKYPKNDKKQEQPATQARAWTVALDQFSLNGGAVNWLDRQLQPQAQLEFTELAVTAKGVQWPMVSPASLEGSVLLPGKGGAARLDFSAQGTDQKGSAQATLKEVSLALAAPYVAEFLEPGLRGMLDAQLGVSWEGGPGKQLKATMQRLSLREVALVAQKGKTQVKAADASSAGLPQFKLLEISNVQVEPEARNASIGKLLLARASGSVSREANGQWMFQSWLRKNLQFAGDEATVPLPALAATPAAPWKLSVGELQVQDASAMFSDRSHMRAVHLDISNLNLQVKAAQLDGKKPVPVVLSAKLKSGQVEAGSLRYLGTLAWDPLLAQGALELLDMPVHALASYFADQTNIDLLRADASFKGQVRYADTPLGPDVLVKGDAALEDFRANSAPGTADSGAVGLGEELLSWKALNVPGINLAISPTAATRVEVREAALSDFYARVIVSPSGRINLQDVMKSPSPHTGASGGNPVASSTAASVASTVSEPVIKVGPVSLVNGKVLFSDRFIQPNFSVDLSDLTGKLSQFSSVATNGVMQLADLELRGRAEGTALLDITGKLNPLAKPLALDIAGKVRELELPPLSPYALKYAGYGIERGKMSVDVRYTVQPDGQLTATNKLVLNQLTFGDKVEGAPNTLPVKLAVALLADRNGVIDLDLPISGSLNDPQFRVGPIIWKVIVNLVTKALTSPFSLLAGAVGGGDTSELGSVAFAPGSAVLPQASRVGLDKVAKALTDRPSLKMTVTGTANLEAEHEAWKRERLKGLLLAEKRRAIVAKGQDVATVGSFTAEEMPALMSAVYRRADITKPRNLVGLTKDIAVADMDALLLANISVNTDAIRDLALQRGVAVKDYLSDKQIAAQRLFLGSAKTTESSVEAKPQAELTLEN